MSQADAAFTLVQRLAAEQPYFSAVGSSGGLGRDVMSQESTPLIAVPVSFVRWKALHVSRRSKQLKLSTAALHIDSEIKVHEVCSEGQRL
jgi:hypothetical protein